MMRIIKQILIPFSGSYASHPARVELGSEALKLQNQAYKGLRNGPVDSHAHLIGIGTGGIRCYANPEYFSWLHPIERLRMLAFMNASGISDRKKADRQ
jgi:hypothetical protein